MMCNTMDLVERSYLEKWRDEVGDKARNGGGQCPVCDQFSKFYFRSVTSSSARNLIFAAKNFDGTFHVNDLPVKNTGGEFARLRYWGLIASVESTGYWRVTDFGKHFAYGYWRISKYAIVYNGDLIGFDGPEVKISDTLSQSFNYEELMAK